MLKEEEIFSIEVHCIHKRKKTKHNKTAYLVIMSCYFIIVRKDARRAVSGTLAQR